MRKKKNRVEVWAGRGRHLCTVQAVALTVVPDTALHPPRKRGSNFWTLALSSILPPANPWKFYMTETVFFLFSFEVLPFVFMGLGGHLCGPIYSGNSRPTRTRANGPIQMAGRRCSWRRAEASAVNTISFLSSCHLLPGRQWLLTSYSVMSQSIFPRC